MPLLRLIKSALGNIFAFCALVSLLLLAGELVWYRVKKRRENRGRNR